MPDALSQLSPISEGLGEEPVSDNAVAVEEVNAVTYQVVEQGTKRKRPMLIDSRGFTYNIHYLITNGIRWQCTSRPKEGPCKVTITQRNGEFKASNECGHNHAPQLENF